MSVRKLKPITPGQRFRVVNNFDVITTDKPEKSLVVPLKKTGGRNNQGKMTMRYIGGGHKKKYRIIDFKRNKVDFIGQPVDVIELPFPKNKQYPQETWEHIEIVMPLLSHESVEDWVNRICNTFLWKELTQLTMKVSEPKVEGEQLPNPSIAVSFVDKTENHVCIKLHPYTIKKILEV